MGSGAGVSRLTPAVEVPAQLEVEVGEVAEGGDEGGPPLFQRLPVLLLETAQQGRHWNARHSPYTRLQVPAPPLRQGRT